MRPSDENQASFTRPNLMSSGHRSAQDDNILAQLEREPVRATTGARLAWYGAAAALAVALTATLAWLAGGSRPAPLEFAQSHSAPPPAPLPAKKAALIVDAPPEPLPAAVAPVSPPLRMLTPAPAPVRVAPPRPRIQPARPVRQARGAAPARPVEPPHDSDVALISAVIVHGQGRSTADELDACGGDACRPRQ